MGMRWNIHGIWRAENRKNRIFFRLIFAINYIFDFLIHSVCIIFVKVFWKSLWKKWPYTQCLKLCKRKPPAAWAWRACMAQDTTESPIPTNLVLSVFQQITRELWVWAEIGWLAKALLESGMLSGGGQHWPKSTSIVLHLWHVLVPTSKARAPRPLGHTTPSANCGINFSGLEWLQRSYTTLAITNPF